LIVDHSVFSKEAVGAESLKKLFTAQTVEVMNFAAVAFEATPNDIKKPDGVPFLETLAFRARVYFLNIPHALVSKGHWGVSW
jgi:hypothetical protein